MTPSASVTPHRLSVLAAAATKNRIPDPTVAVVGCGYVGFALATAFAEHFDVVAYDISPDRIQTLQKTTGHLCRLRLTTDPADLGAATFYLVSVPTMVRDDGTINPAHVRDAIRTVCRHARAGSTIVIESSVAVGMTRDLLAPVMRRNKFKGGMSPERVDPGRTFPPFASIPKIISGLDDVHPDSLRAISDVYSRVFDTVVPVSSPEVAEMTKLYENCQRMMCIGFANEMADACRDGARAIDPYEVAAAAATKPFGYLPVFPGLGVGGHCIPVNPHYLRAQGEQFFPLLAAATDATAARPAATADRLLRGFARRAGEGGPPVSVLVVGVAFKPGESLTVNAPGVAFMARTQTRWGITCKWVDPLVREAGDKVPGVRLSERHVWNRAELSQFDLIVVAMKQQGLDWDVLDEVQGQGPVIEMFCK